MRSKMIKLLSVSSTFVFAGLTLFLINSNTAVAQKLKPSKSNRRDEKSRVLATSHKALSTTPHKASSSAPHKTLNATPLQSPNPAAKKIAPKQPIVKQAAQTKAPVAISSSKGTISSILASTTGLRESVLQLGLNSYYWAEKHSSVSKPYLTIVDFSIPSKDKRLWVINMNTHKVVIKTLVANGKNSGLLKGTNFSNAFNSKESSLGVYVTGSRYYGGDGLSLHVKGLQSGVNSNAYRRLIEFHGANYVSPSFAAHYGRVGRSWGCFALDKSILPKVVSTIENGSVVFAYADGHQQDFKPYS